VACPISHPHDIVAHDDMIAKAHRTKEIIRAMNKNPSLALKANITHSRAREARKEERELKKILKKKKR
jgi:predicted GIY-YIG superfamily endonuclease